MSDVPVLRDARVTLKPVGEPDAEARLHLGRHPEIHRAYGGSTAEFEPMTAEDAAAWCRGLAGHTCAWGIFAPSLIGSIRLDGINRQDRRATLAVGIDAPDQLGHGYGPEAIRLVLGHAFGPLGLHRVGLRVLAFNERAIRAYQACGFRIEGREREAALVDECWHDDLIMGILAHEFSGAGAVVGNVRP